MKTEEKQKKRGKLECVRRKQNQLKRKMDI
jgi:hypothetical protein